MKAKIYFETYGCSLNSSDTETMKGLLKKEGYGLVDDKGSADIIIINSCTVKLPTFNKFKFLLKKYRKRKLIIAGCVPQTNLELLKDISAIGVEQLKQIAHVVQETLEGNVVHLVSRSTGPRLNLPKIRRNRIIEIIPVSRGCLGECSYCKVKLARGSLFSYDPKEIVRQLKTGLKEGIKEVWLTSQDNGAYGQDIGTTIIELLKTVLSIKGDFKVRLGMANPNFVYKYLDGFLELYNNRKLFRFLHTPVQSGSNSVLKAMRRKYTIEDFMMAVVALRHKYPDLTISTDVICGFPTETERDFLTTMQLIKDIKPDIINISKFSPMDQTEAAKMKLLTTQTVKSRSQKMTALYRKLSTERNRFWIGWKGEVLVDEKGKKSTWIARNYAYKPVILKKGKLGEKKEVKIIRTTAFDLRTS